MNPHTKQGLTSLKSAEGACPYYGVGVKKILFIVTQSEFGGAQRYIYELTRSLEPEKYEILVAAGEGDGELFRKLRSAGVRSVSLKRLKRTPWPWQIFLAIGEIYNLLKKEKPDVLFLCSTTCGLLGSLAAKIYKLKTKNYQLKTIYRIGGWAFRDPRASWQNWVILLVEKLTAHFKNKIIVNSEIDRELALKYKIASAQKIVKIYNGIDVDSLNFLPKEEARKRLISEIKQGCLISEIVIGCVANFYKTKGLEYLIEAASRSDLRGRSDLQILIIGEGKERPKLETLIKKYSLENQVFLVGRIPDAYKYLKAFDIFVLPSLKEGFPWIILEAMAAELPIVATKVGALPEIIEDGKEGFLVETKSSQLLAEKINWLLSHPDEAKNMGWQAKKKLEEKFTLQKMVEATESTVLPKN